MFSRTTTRSTFPIGARTPGYVFAGRRFAYRSNSLRSATFTERKPLPSSVVRGPLRPTLLRRIDSSASGGNGVPYFAIAGTPISCRSHSIGTPVASTARRVASTISGPVPSPGMSVMRCVVTVVILVPWAARRSFGRPCRFLPGLHRLVARDLEIVTLLRRALVDGPAHDGPRRQRLATVSQLREQATGEQRLRFAREEAHAQRDLEARGRARDHGLVVPVQR